jgi:hypothetical protein
MSFDQLFQIVNSDPALREDLLKAPDLPSLFAKILTLAKARNCPLTEQDLQAIVNANRRSWLERWL